MLYKKYNLADLLITEITNKQLEKPSYGTITNENPEIQLSKSSQRPKLYVCLLMLLSRERSGLVPQNAISIQTYTNRS